MKKNTQIIKINHPTKEATLVIAVGGWFKIDGKQHMYNAGVHQTTSLYDLDQPEDCYCCTDPVYAPSMDALIHLFFDTGELETNEEYGIEFV